MKKHLIWVIPTGIVFFLLVEVFIFLPLYILGLVLLPYCLWFGNWTIDERGLYHLQNRVLDELFGNFEDGLNPLWWAKANPGKNGPYSAYLWFIRNPVTNMRHWPAISTLPKKTVMWVGNVDEVPDDKTPGWFIAWQGPYAGFFYQTERYRLWLGFKTNPRDARENAPHDYRYDGLGLASQFMRF